MTTAVQNGQRLKYRQAMVDIEARIAEGIYLPGAQLPPIKVLAGEMGLNYLTVLKAVHTLAEQGALEVVHGVGTFVNDPHQTLGTNAVRVAVAFRSYFFRADEQSPAVGAYLAGAHRRFDAPDYLLQSLSYDKHQLTHDLGPMLISQKIAGLVIVGGGIAEEDCRFLHAAGIRAVVVGQPSRHRKIVSVEFDRMQVMRCAIEHLRSLGHKRVAFLSYAEVSDGGKADREYARLTFDMRLGDPRELLLTVRNPNRESMHWEDVEVLFELDAMPTAVVTRDAHLADVVLDGCARRGLEVPDDLSVVTLVDSNPNAHRVPLTTPENAADVGRLSYAACDALARLIDGEPPAERHIVLEPELKVKASSGPVSPV